MDENKPKLMDGSEWMDHEDCIVGNESGLKNLIKACEVALVNNEYYGNDLGHYVGVKKLDSKYFRTTEQPQQSNGSCYGMVICLKGGVLNYSAANAPRRYCTIEITVKIVAIANKTKPISRIGAPYKSLL